MSSDVMAGYQGLSCAVPDGPDGPASPPRKRRRKRYAAQRAGGRGGLAGAVGPASPAAGRCGCRLSAPSGPAEAPMAVETGDSVIRQQAAVQGG